MSIPKTLIYFPTDQIKPCGGPAGYLYNLSGELFSDSGIDFLPPSGEGRRRNSISNKVPQKLKSYLRPSIYKQELGRTASPPVDISRYDIIHFHMTRDLYFCRKELDSYKGHVVLTSHTPCAPHVERMARVQSNIAPFYVSAERALKQIDSYAFQRADTIIFPCPSAEEPYFSTWREYQELRDEDKIRYLLTGTKKPEVALSRNLMREKLGIPEDAFVISYVGRHNEIKGYFDLREIAPLLIEKGYWIVVAGRQDGVAPLRHSRWIEIGWTDDPFSIMNMSDVYLLPNQQTYFDLALLEALAIGSVILTTNTGGNKHFATYSDSGIFLYESRDKLISLLAQIQSMRPFERDWLSKRNIEIYETYFTTKEFAKSYKKLLIDIL